MECQKSNPGQLGEKRNATSELCHHPHCANSYGHSNDPEWPSLVEVTNPNSAMPIIPRIVDIWAQVHLGRQIQSGQGFKIISHDAYIFLLFEWIMLLVTKVMAANLSFKCFEKNQDCFIWHLLVTNIWEASNRNPVENRRPPRTDSYLSEQIFFSTLKV